MIIGKSSETPRAGLFRCTHGVVPKSVPSTATSNHAVGEEASFVAFTLAVVLRGAAGRAPPGRARGRGRGRGQARLPHLHAGGAGARRARAPYPVDGLLPGRSGLPDGGVRGGR